jgi:uncharacterized protein (DUF779 family)
MDPARVTATPAALDLVARVVDRHGPVILFQSGGCCDGSSPICLPDGELLLGPGDLRLGDVGGAAVYIDRDQYARWNSPAIEIDAAPGPAEGLSLDSLEDHHFISRGAS